MSRERAARSRAPLFIDPPGYVRHRPEGTLLYQLVERYYPEFVMAREAADRPLPKYVQEEFAAYLKCGRLEHGFLRVRCDDCHAEKLVAFSCKRRGFCPHVLKKAQLTRTSGATGAVTLIQRFGSALNLNVHFHMLVLDGAYFVGTEPPVFRRIAPPGEAELQALVERLAERIGRGLERGGVLARDAESSFLELGPAAGGPIDDLLGHSITYRVAIGPRVGQKVFSLQTVAAREEGLRKGVAQYAGFSLHAGLGVEAQQQEKLERLARYVSQPPVSVERLSLTAQGHVRYRLKTAYRDGTTDIVLEPVDFIARLAALVPPPRVHLTRYHGVFAANAALRAAITPAGRGSKARSRAPERPPPKHVALNWARRLKRVFGIEIEQCARCGGLARDREHRGAGADRADSRAPAAAGRGGGADGLARSPGAAAGVVILILDDRRRTRAVSARAAGSTALDDAEGASWRRLTAVKRSARWARGQTAIATIRGF